MNICLFNPALRDNQKRPSENLGDFIIEEAVKRELFSLFPNVNLFELSTHVVPSYKHHLSIASKCDLIFAGGTNLLNSHMKSFQQWKLSLKQKITLGKAILFGVGWAKYESTPDLYTQLSINCLLSKKIIHSTRDSYTLKQLNSIGIKNVLNTGCPTMWPFLEFDFSKIPHRKSRTVLVMITDYAKDYQLDKQLIETAIDNYESVIFWPQGKGDLDYIIELLLAINNMTVNVEIVGSSRVKDSNIINNLKSRLILLEHSLEGFNNLLESDIEFDYIGTRLHGGIKCLLSCRRSLILEIDNRAAEIAKDTGLPTVKRGEIDKIKNWIISPSMTEIYLDPEPIKQWRSQFNMAVK
ncbi:polysaccharide pyruvyl transferase family protein [Sphaerospermopsis aphanizomenoides BCCUSP55]|nr:polysaccharide pyruvyl transferase family protein [Sphaerospermopsis aphanizomenoides BCCUSP55]